jgi:hypothetical protein
MKIKFEPRDLWVGLYWKRSHRYAYGGEVYRDLTWYLCLLPCLPILWTTTKVKHVPQ